ncbi:MAG: hypothetical protein HZA52_03520 [Planctomycetes bacterium]|nr:hypothetical protein [Planctomycetota bacterium]
MQLPSAPRSRAWNLAIVAPFVACALWSSLIRPELRSFAAPLFGPWAGYLYGHHDCTLATISQSASVASAVFGALAFGAYARVRSRAARMTISLVLLLWSSAWAATAALSVLNTTS